MNGLLRINQIVGQPEKTVTRHYKTGPRVVTIPAIPTIIPVSRTTWWRGVREGKYPKPVYLGEKTTAWLESDIKKLVEKIQGGV